MCWMCAAMPTFDNLCWMLSETDSELLVLRFSSNREGTLLWRACRCNTEHPLCHFYRLRTIRLCFPVRGSVINDFICYSKNYSRKLYIFIITRSHGSVRVLWGRPSKSMGNGKIWPSAVAKPPNRSSPNLKYVIMSRPIYEISARSLRRTGGFRGRAIE